MIYVQVPMGTYLGHYGICMIYLAVRNASIHACTAIYMYGSYYKNITLLSMADVCMANSSEC